MSFLKIGLVKTMFYLEDYVPTFFQSWIKFHVKDQNVILLSNVCFDKTTALIAIISLRA